MGINETTSGSTVNDGDGVIVFLVGVKSDRNLQSSFSWDSGDYWGDGVINRGERSPTGNWRETGRESWRGLRSFLREGSVATKVFGSFNRVPFSESREG